MYLDMLEIATTPLTTEAVKYRLDSDGNSLLDGVRVYFQQYGAAPHYVFSVRQWLDNEFPSK